MIRRAPGAKVMTGVIATGLACCLGLGSCASTSSSTAADGGGDSHDVSTRQRLLHLAERAAASMGGSIKSVQAVESRRSAAVRLTSGGIVRGNQPVWAIQIEGVHRFVCRVCSYPAGATPPGGRFLTFIVDAKTFATTDSGIGSPRVDLSNLGTVINLER
jgi:hypothetical protein